MIEFDPPVVGNPPEEEVVAPPSRPHTTPLPKKDGGGYAETGYTAAELIEAYGENPDGSPRTEPVPDTPNCPSVSLSDGPFDTTAIPPGCNEPLSAECAAYYNDQRTKQGYTE